GDGSGGPSAGGPAAGQAGRSPLQGGDDVERAGDIQAGAPALLPVAVALPVSKPGTERIRRLRERGEPQPPPGLPVVGREHPQLDHRRSLPIAHPASLPDGSDNHAWPVPGDRWSAGWVTSGAGPGAGRSGWWLRQRRWRAPTTRAASRAQDVPNRTPAIASDSQWAAR